MNNQIKEVYIVTDGEYSDYGIEAVFFDKEKAEEFRKERGFDEVETWIPATEKTVQRWSLWIYEDGSVGDITFQNFEKRGSLDFDIYQIPSKEKRISYYISAETEEKAIKIANDHRRQLIAEGKM